MSARFIVPDWMLPAERPVPPEVDPHRVESLVNRFISGKQDALFTAPDAYYRTTGIDAVDGAPAIAQRLQDLRTATLDQARDDGERAALGDRLDAHIAEASDGIGRHVAAQRDAFNRQTLAERQALIRRAAELEHTNDDKLAGLAEANAGTAAELARMKGEPEAPAINAARSTIWRTAIDQRLANANGPQALDLFERVKGQLAPGDRRDLDVPMQTTAVDRLADRWIEREAATPGEPLAIRLQTDPDLSPADKASVLTKIAERDSAKESSRFAMVKGIDDKLSAASRTLAIAPATYKPGTLVILANAYDDSGEPDKAAATRRLAQQEHDLQRFAKSSVEDQQRLIASLPEDGQEAAETIQRQQADAFARDALVAGTILYPYVGKPVPINDIEGRIQQARRIAQLRGIPVAPFTANEIATISRALTKGPDEERDAVLETIRALPEDMQAAIGSVPKPEEDGRETEQPLDMAQVPPSFPVKPPSYPVQPRPIPRYKDPIPGLSGKGKADDIPSDFLGKRPLVGESGRQAADRVFDELLRQGPMGSQRSEDKGSI